MEEILWNGKKDGWPPGPSPPCAAPPRRRCGTTKTSVSSPQPTRGTADFPYYMEKPAGRYLYLCCRGRWDISAGYAAFQRHILEAGLKTAGDFYACDLAGFILNSVEKNAASMLSIRLAE